MRRNPYSLGVEKAYKSFVLKVCLNNNYKERFLKKREGFYNCVDRKKRTAWEGKILLF